MENLNIIDVRGYYEKVISSSKTKPNKVGVLKVRYEDGSWEIIYRHSFKDNNVQQYKNIEIEQIKQVSNLVSKKEQTILNLYLKQYVKYNLNMRLSITNNLYIENMKQNFLSRIKYVLQQI